MTDARFAYLHRSIDDRIRELRDVQALIPAAAAATKLTLPDGYPSGGGEPVSGGGTSNPTLAVIVAREEALDERYDRTREDFRRVGLNACETSNRVIHAAVTEIRTELTRLIAPTITGPATVGLLPGAGICHACRRYVRGGRTDRLRGGLCPRDHTRWLRLGQPDRMAFIRQVQIAEGVITADQPTVQPDPDEEA